MDADGGHISEYASKTRYPKLKDTGEVEDFADSFMMYVATDSAQEDKVKPLRDLRKNSFTKLDEVFEELAARQASGRLGNLKRRIFKSSGALAA